MEAHYILKKILRTEKSVNDTTQYNRYHFEVHRGATKFQIREAVEELFPDIKVKEIRTSTVRGKRRRYRFVKGKRRSTKKAIVTLRPGDSINVGY